MMFFRMSWWGPKAYIKGIMDLHLPGDQKHDSVAAAIIKVYCCFFPIGG